MSYDFKTIEAQAQQRWADTRAFEVSEDPDRPKYYCLCMLPYPSGAIHMGHVRNYTIGDVISRAKRMAGYNVLQPMGWDAFGLPAENAAIKHGVAPAEWTYRNIAQMRAQLQALGFAYDWTRELTTCKPEYYRWEQLLFVRLMAKGLVYRKNSVVNWDPVDQTVLANEQVVDGRGWRSGAPVERKEIAQWFFRITAYADELLAEIDRLDGWPESVKAMQRNWIGKSEGLEISFDVIDHDQPLRVYTTRPDTLAGATYVAVAAEHPLARLAAERNPHVAEFVAECAHIGVAEATIETLEKRGVATGWQVRHPLSGEALPVYVANFVLMGYGTGAVMAVPGHDARDHAFARKYGLPIRQVIKALDGREIDIDAAAYTEHGLLINSGPYDGLDYRAAFDAIANDLAARGMATRKINYRLRDWGVSRQRYWGCPIPVLYRADGSAVPVPEGELPVVLPEDVAFRGVASPLVDDPSFTHYVDPVTGETLRRETDTFDTFVQSSWYYARYTCPDASDILDARARYWLPIDHYIGGIEHATMHLLYFRFWHKLLRDAGLVDSDEPALKLLCQGMVVAETFYRETDGQRSYYNPSEVETESDSRGRLVSARLRSDGEPVTIGPIEKMSKSKNNGVDPQTLIERYGADTVRLFSMFAAPPEQSLEWSEAGVDGMARFLRRLWNQIERHLEVGAPPAVDYSGLSLSAEQRRIRRLVHDTLAKVSDDVERRLHFNTAIAAIMELINALAKVESSDAITRMTMQEAWETIVLMLNPITPHICEALWTRLGKRSPLVDERWPTVDESARARDLVNVVVQVNGKLRAQLELSPDLDAAAVEQAARGDAQVARYLAEGSVRKVIVVANKLINFVVQ